MRIEFWGVSALFIHRGEDWDTYQAVQLVENGKVCDVVPFDPWIWDRFVGDALCVGFGDAQDGDIWVC